MDPLDQPTLDSATSGTPDVLSVAARLVIEELSVSAADVQIARGRLQGAMQRMAEDRPRRSIFRPVPRAMWYTAVGVAFSILLLILGWQAGTHRLSNGLASRTSTYMTAQGERATITLPDGSTVMLNVASRLDVPVNYAAGNRTVRLTGAALFTVMHHDETPFTVVAGASTTRVLGTSFVVRHYASDSLTTIAVRDGKVAVRSAVLVGGTQVTVGTHGIGNIQPANPAAFSFVSGVLALKDLPLPAAIPELNRWYDADIRLGNPALARRRITGVYDAGSLAELSMILEMTFNVRVVRDGRTLTLFPR